MPWVPAAITRAFIKRLLVTWQHPEDAIFEHGAVLINSCGERFCDERRWPERELSVAQQPDKSAFILLDQALIERFSHWPDFISTAPEIAYAYVADYLKLCPDVSIKAGSLRELSKRRGLPDDALQHTVEATNLERGTSALPALSGNQWILLGPLKAYFTTTEGGAAINQQFEVLAPTNHPIRGLYAVGQNGLGGQILWGHGLHIGWALTSGKLVAEQLAARKRGQSHTTHFAP